VPDQFTLGIVLTFHLSDQLDLFITAELLWDSFAADMLIYFL
jgi:hypothetical protein